MKQVPRWMRLAFWLAATVLASGHAAADESPKPRPLLALFETTRISLPQGPLPDGLRVVLYDDGEIITRSGPTQADPDPPGRGVTFGILERGAAESLWRDAVADLNSVSSTHSGLAAAADAGTTILEVWDGERYRQFSANAWPCAAEGRPIPQGLWQRNREQTDASFIKVCDRLMRYNIPAPQPWAPKAA